MKRYINIDEFKLPCTPGDCYECIFFSLNKCIMKEHINNAPAANVIEVTDKSMESLVKGLEILGNTKNYAGVVEIVTEEMMDRCEYCEYRNTWECGDGWNRCNNHTLCESFKLDYDTLTEGQQRAIQKTLMRGEEE